MGTVPHELIKRVVRSKLAKHGLKRVEAQSGFDHDGDPALFVHATLVPNSPIISGDVMVATIAALNEALGSIGDQPYAYLYIQHPDDDRPEPAALSPEATSS